ncbi:hypothetical protein BpHYR1_045140 [Brachionus plicatilis]|uniref:Uncharacterized protein n=1 Tax=Brachionus plicatilis TaxID=10195 RepID=A0A3M7QPV6_BRAPC|nr:hypothetical protein BpHYR1_045140 [Brachionus plicatilis]
MAAVLYFYTILAANGHNAITKCISTTRQNFRTLLVSYIFIMTTNPTIECIVIHSNQKRQKNFRKLSLYIRVEVNGNWIKN